MPTQLTQLPPTPAPLTPQPLPHHIATKRCEWIECIGAEDGANKGSE